MTDQKFCRDCKHFMRAVGYSPMCFHPRNMSEPDLVYGERNRISSPADLRKPDGICGPDGVMFEAKPAFIEIEPPPAPPRSGLRQLFRL